MTRIFHSSISLPSFSPHEDNNFPFSTLRFQLEAVYYFTDKKLLSTAACILCVLIVYCINSKSTGCSSTLDSWRGGGTKARLEIFDEKT